MGFRGICLLTSPLNTPLVVDSFISIILDWLELMTSCDDPNLGYQVALCNVDSIAANFNKVIKLLELGQSAFNR